MKPFINLYLLLVMRKNSKFNLVLFILVFSIFYSCKEDPPIADFTCTQEEINGEIHVTYADLSSNNPDHWEWNFGGGTPRSSKEQNPTIVYKNPGIFDVNLKISNDGGSDDIYKANYARIVRIISQIVTDAEISVGNQKQILPANSYTQFAMFDNPSDDCHIETSGKDENGNQIGILIYWDVTVSIIDYYYYVLGISNELVFFNVTNNSNTDFTHFMVNCWNPNFESLEEISMPNDGIKHATGYYFANEGMEIRAYSPGGYLSLKDSEDFYLPWTNNQFVNLSFNGTVKTQNNLEFDAKTNNSGLDVKHIVLKTEESQNAHVILESGYKLLD
jgi:PKD repeat protein